MLPKDYLESRDQIQDLHSELIGKGEREVMMLSVLLERAQRELSGYQHMMQLMLRHDAGLLSEEETANMFTLMGERTNKRQMPSITNFFATKAAKQSTTTASAKRSRKRGLEDEVVKPTDDLT